MRVGMLVVLDPYDGHQPPRKMSLITEMTIEPHRDDLVELARGVWSQVISRTIPRFDAPLIQLGFSMRWTASTERELREAGWS